MNNTHIQQKVDILKEKIRLIELQLSHAKAEIHMMQEKVFDMEEMEVDAMLNIPGWRN